MELIKKADVLNEINGYYEKKSEEYCAGLDAAKYAIYVAEVIDTEKIIHCESCGHRVKDQYGLEFCNHGMKKIPSYKWYCADAIPREAKDESKD